jgi:hypothetical protein
MRILARQVPGNDPPINPANPVQVTKLFIERLQAWKHACGYLEEYITATEKIHHSHSKDFDKVLKVSQLQL